jgi:endonuclease G
MDRKRRMTEARMDVARAAGRRWLERADIRKSQTGRLADGGPAAADAPGRVQKHELRERMRAGARPPLLRAERQIGPTLDFTTLPANEEQRRAGSPVARIVTLPAPGYQMEGFGTGFLVAPSLLLTNHHVLPTRSDARGIGANFRHEYAPDGRLQAGVVFELDPDAFFVSDEALDFALVAVRPKAEDGTPLTGFGELRLIQSEGKILIGQPISIIQHPSGGPKKYAVAENKLLDILAEGYLHYSTDTLPGSSGSPAFNTAWEVVGLHHSSVPAMSGGQVLDRHGRIWDPETMTDDDVQWIANESIRVSSLVRHWAAVRIGDAAQQRMLQDLVKRTADPLESVPSAAGSAPDPSNQGSVAMTSGFIHIYGPTTIHIQTPAPPPVAVASVPASVAVSAIEKKIRFDRNYKNREGYDPEFLGIRVDLPTVDDSRRGEMLKTSNGRDRVLKYHHFSVAMNEERRLQMWSAVNVDYSPERRSDRSRADFGTDTWIADPRIAGELQIDDDAFYRPATKMDRGHIVRRDDNAWGDSEIEIEYANSDTFHWTNCTPQHEAFNRENLQGVWGRLESHIKDELHAANNRASIFAGPVLDNANDPEVAYEQGTVQYPLRFWKVIIVVGDHGALQAYGFILDQTAAVKRFGIEAMDFRAFKRWQVSLDDISRETAVVFPDELRNADVLARTGGARVEIRHESDVRLQ